MMNNKKMRIFLLKNKKAEERYLSPIMFLVWAIIAISIFVGVLIFYSAKTDVRAEEAEFLGVRVADCLVNNGYLNENIIEGFNIFEECKLSEKIISTGNFYLYVGFSDASNFHVFFPSTEALPNKPIKPIEKGDRGLKSQCEIKQNIDSEARYFAECFKTKVYALDKSDNSKILIEIITGSNQLGREV